MTDENIKREADSIGKEMGKESESKSTRGCFPTHEAPKACGLGLADYGCGNSGFAFECGSYGCKKKFGCDGGSLDDYECTKKFDCGKKFNCTYSFDNEDCEKKFNCNKTSGFKCKTSYN